MSEAPPSDAANYDVEGAWDPNKVYTGVGGATGSENGPNGQPLPADMVEYLGAWWDATYYTQGITPDSPSGNGWSLDAGSKAPNYNPVVPDAPTSLAAGYTSGSEVALFWDSPEIEGEGQVSSYNVYANGALLGTTTGNSYTAKDLTAGEKYVFSVTATDQTGTSGNQSQFNYNGKINENPDPAANPTLAVITPKTSAAASGKTFSPYLDMTNPITDLQNISQATKLRDFTLAFLQTTNSEVGSNGKLINGMTPSLSFGGLTTTSLPTGEIIAEVKNVEAEGGVVTASIGGYNGYDPAVIATQYISNLEAGDSAAGIAAEGPVKATQTAVANLVQEYQYVISTYGVNSLDFDIENTATVNNTAANHLRDLAIKQLEANNPGLKVSFTLATTPEGLNGAADANATSGSGDDLRVLSQAKTDGVTIDTVNIMAMDYYDGTSNMLQNAETAAVHVENQIVKLGLTAGLSLTPMIGQNDDYGSTSTDPVSGTTSGDGVDEVFTLADARALEKWVATKSYITGLNEWEMTRDAAATTDTTGQAPNETSSGVIQSAYQFTKILDAITTTTTTTSTPNASAALLRQAAAAFSGDAGAAMAAYAFHPAGASAMSLATSSPGRHFAQA